MKRVFVTTTASVIVAVLAVVALILIASALGGLWVLGLVGGVLGLCAALLNDVVLCAYAFALPVVTAYTALTTLIDDTSGIVLRASSRRLAHTGGDIYVIQGLGERSRTFASSVFARLEAAQEDAPKPLVVFSDIASDELPDTDARRQALREEGGSVATVLFTPVAIEDIPDDLAVQSRSRCHVHYLAITGDTSRNVRSAIKVTDSLVRMMELQEGEQSPGPKAREKLGRLGKKVPGLLLEGPTPGQQDSAQAALTAFLAQEQGLRQGLPNSYPTLCELGDIEHVRWNSFYRSQGWRGVRTLSELERLNTEVGDVLNLESGKGHASPSFCGGTITSSMTL